MWKINDGETCKKPVVILCAGEGRRLLDIGREIPKAMVLVNNKPLISYVINYWSKFASSFIFVVGYKKEQLIKYIQSTNPVVPFSFVEQEKPKGIAHAIKCAKPGLNGDFIVALSDCLCIGDFIFPEIFSQGVGVWETVNESYIRQSYSVELGSGRIARVTEKPKILVNNLCGLGYYFFGSRVFDYIELTPPSQLRNEVEITDVIQKMIESGEEIKPLHFKGAYLNITSPEDISKAGVMFNL